MRERANAYVLQLNKHNLLRAGTRRVIAVLSLVVVLGVFWCLKLTGITMAGEAFCGMDEHVHGDRCPDVTLICPLDEEEAHAHDESCILRELICEEEERPPHTHDEDCLERELICTEEETEGHTHDDNCRSRSLVCEEEEREGHAHDSDCYEEELVCEEAEEEGHQHDSGCYEEELTCGEEESEEHSHGDSCMSEELTCSEEEYEGHQHGGDCYESHLVCTEEEIEGHWHDDDCYVLEEGYSCGEEEIPAHTHDDACYILLEGSYICGEEETEGHEHDDDCWSLGVGFGCGLTEADDHVHTEECLTEETQLDCGKEATEGHEHGAACYEELEECPLEEHIHVESCYSNLDADLEDEDDWERIAKKLEPGMSTADHVVAMARSQLGYEESTRNFEVDLHGVRRGVTRYGQWYGNPYGDWSAMFVSFCLHYAGAEDLPANAGPESMRLEWEKAGLYRPAGEAGPKVGSLIFLSPDPDAEPEPMEWEEPEEAAEELPDEIAEALPEEETEEPEEAAEDSPEETFEEGAEEEPVEEEPAESTEEESLEEALEEAPSEEEAEEPAQPAAGTFGRSWNEAGIVAIVTEMAEDYLTVIQGDLDGEVAEYTVPMDDARILGYGFVPERSPFMLMAAPSGLTYVGKTIDYNANMFTAGRSFVVYTERDGVYYAFDGNGNAVPVEIGEDGSICANVPDPETLLWSFTRNGSSYVIRNLSTGRHIHPFYNSSRDYGIITDTGWNTDVVASGGGAILRHSAYARLRGDSAAFEMTRNQGEASVFRFGVAERTTIWLDGTNGNLMSLQGSPKESRGVTVGETIRLPSEWPSPAKYSYVLRGWYDVRNGEYYAPGEEVTVTEELLFYADWAAASYDIGRMNGDVVDSVSTAEFITTHVFDYNSLFNTLSMNNNYTGGDSARWTLVENGTVQSTGQETLDFIFIDYDDPGNPGAISYPVGRNQANGTDYTVVTPGLYDPNLTELLFDPDLDVAGKHYIGEADHLFQYGADPSDTEHYGYFYYDSMLNAASYHQGDERFYVYDYLERTADSENNNSYSDFLPLNSPYENTNGKTPGTYTYNGVHNEYGGTTHYAYDSKYSDSDNSPNRVITNYWFGMTMEMDFYLPSVPGTRDSDGTFANQSITGDDMVFEFSGDDDVWVLIDGQLVLDIGGIHGVEAGSIDFSTGDVIVDGVKTGTVTNLAGGSHTLTMYYLERGSSMSNFKLRFNLSTRYSMTLRKEDTLTAHLLDGAQFAVYTDEACTHPAELWPSRDAHERGEPSTNIFAVENGQATMWGFAAGNTYYLEEVRGPDALNGMMANGIIRMRLNNQGQPDYEVMANHSGDLTVGYMVHGYKVNEDTQEAYLVITNSDAYESEPTEVYVEKRWADGVNHSGDSVTVYLAANGIRIQAVTLNQANNWRHTWVNLPKTDANGNEIEYTVREATVPGYVGKVETITGSSSGGSSGSGTGGGVTSAGSFTNGQTYLLQTRFGYLATDSNGIALVSGQSAAQNSSEAQWVASVHSDGTVTLTNKAGRTLYYDNYTFKASASPGSYKNLNFSGGKLYCYINHGGWSETQYPVDSDDVASNVTYNHVLYTTNNSAQALTITPQLLGAPEPEPPPSTGNEGGNNFRITNTPAGEYTISLRVKKQWDPGSLGNPSDYEGLTVQMRLLADGEDAGLIGTLSLRNGWSYTFQNLPKYDSGGDEIAYTVEEINLPSGWSAEYGPVTSIGGSDTAYETTVTNVCRMSVELPSTGGIGPYGYITLGLLIMLGSLSWYCGQRRKCERREC